MSIRSFFGFGKGRKSQSQSSKRALRMEALEERALLSAAPLSTSEYADLRAEYAEFNLPANMNDLNVITLDLAQGDGLSQLKSAISTAGTTTKSDLIVVRTSNSAYSLTYTSASNELNINIDSSKYGSITIIGIRSSSYFTLDADDMCRVMTVSGANTIANFGGVSFAYGYSRDSAANIHYGGAIFNNAATLTVSNCGFGENSSTNGGAIFNAYNGKLNIVNCRFEGNYGDSGGGIGNGSGIVTITNSTFSGNEADNNGGCISNSGTMTITGCTITESEAGNSGGGIFSNGTLTVNNSVISNNSAKYAGGGIYNSKTLTVSNTNISNNNITATELSSDTGWSSDDPTGGGGIYNRGTLSVLNNTIISGNVGRWGGGGIKSEAYSSGTPSITVSNSRISNNDGGSYGGGIANIRSTATITNSRITGNTANSGAGIDITGNGSSSYVPTTTVTNCIISGNTAKTHGGGIEHYGGYYATINITNCTISGNKATNSGGGIYFAFRSSGGDYVYNTIVVSNTTDVTSNETITGYNNLSSYTGWSGSGNITYNASSPLFANAAKGDYRLAAGSQAIDKGSNTYANNAGLTSASKDLSGNRRFDGTIDIGAYEYQKNVTYSTVVTTLEDSYDLYDDEWSLREAISYAPVYYSTGYPTITFAEGLEGEIDLTRGQLEITSPLVIDGDDRITIDAQQKSRVFYVNAGTAEQQVIFNGLAIQNGFTNGVTTMDGAGIYLDSGNLIINNSAIWGNTAAGTDCNAGGIFNHKGTLSLNESVVSGNTADYAGGIYNYSGTLSVTNCVISQNSAKDAGGIRGNVGSITITDTTITGNSASGSGGGIGLTHTDAVIINSAILNNSGFKAGGIYNKYNSNLKLTNCTIAGNTATGTAGGILTSATITSNNTIIASNMANGTSDIIHTNDDGSTSIGTVKGSNNLSSYTTWSSGSGNLTYNSSNPLFVDAANGDYHLIDSSQAIDKGSNVLAVGANGAALVYDLDNRTRIVYGVVDIGAYEYRSSLASPTLTVSAAGSDSISVTVGEAANAAGYTVEYSTSEDFSDAVSQNVSAGVTTITGLTAETTYYFRALALGSGDYGDSAYSEIQSATTLSEHPEVNARIVFQDSLKDVDVSSELPTGISSIRAGKTVYAEIWIKDIEDTDPAIIGGYVNMLYDSDALSVLDVTYGTVFSTLTSNPDVSTAGLIDLIGGGAGQGVLNMGDDEWVRLATVSFDADAEGLTTVSLAAPNDYRDNITRVGGVILTNSQIDFGSAELEIIAACPMDIDGDGYIGMSDYGLLSSAWRSSPGKDNWNPACDIDGDGYVGMSDYAFLSNNWRKYTDDPSLVYPTASASPAAAVSSEIIIDPYNLTAYSDNAIADVRLTAVSTKTASDAADEVPASLTQVAPGESFFVEIWVRNFNGYDGSNLCGLFGGYLNMSYPSDSLAVGDVTYSSIFPQFNGLQDVSVPGIIDLIGGVTAMGVKDKGDDEWVRLATVEFTASATGDVLIESLPPTDSHDNLTLASTTGRLLKNDEIDFGSLNLTIADNVIQLASPTLSASATGSNSVSVTVGSVTNASGYRVEYSTSADFANAVSQNVNAGKTTVSGLNAETTYYFRAMALGTGDYSNSNYSESATATTLPAPVLEAEVNARVVFQDSLKDADTAAELPEGITSIRATKTVYAEIWVKDVEDTDPAIIGGYLNMLYDSDALSVLDVTYGTEICYLTGFQTYENGEIATIGGTTAPSVLDKGDDEWVRLATVSFVADMEGFTTVSLGAPNDYHDNITRTDGRILSNAQIDYGSSVLEVTAACPMDIDGDGYIGVSDYSLLSKAWRSSPGKENWDPACDIDGDGYVGVSDYTFLSKNWRKYADDPDLVYPEANASPAAPVSENVVIASPAAVVSEDNFIEMNNTAALEADETANVLLTAVSTKTASDTADEVPSSLTEINPGDSFFVEIWVRNFNGYEGSNLCGLTGGYLNMSYPEELLNLGDVTYGRVFSQLNNFQDVSQAGFIDLIGGVAGAGVLDKGDNEWVRLATVSFTASENGDALIESLPPTDSHDNLTLTSGKTLKNDEISFGVINLKIGSTVIQLKVNNDFIKTTLNNSVVIAYRENDAVADWSETTVEFGDASNGEYSVNGNGTITYTPADGFYGTDAVSYVVVDPSGELSTGAIVISVGLPIATSVQKTSGSHSPSSAMAASVERLTDWDNCCVELWAQDVNALNPGETTFTLSYNPTIYNAPYFSACADGVALSVTDSAALPDGSVEVQLTARVLESLSSQTNNLFLGTVVLTPSMDDGAGVVSPLSAEPVCALDGAETPTTVEAMPYDLIRNGSVDVNDFVAFATVFGYVPGNMSPINPLYVQTAKSDFNKDGSVNADDFVLFAINFGATKNTADKPAPLASAASELRVASNELREGVLKSECKTALPLVEQLPSSNYSQLKAEAYSAALLDLYDNQDVADLSGSSDVLAKSRMDAQLFDVESDSSHKASSQAIDAVLEEDLLAIDWN